MVNDQPMQEKHVLICTLGESTEVVTEVLDKLLEEKKIPISEVALIHTTQPKVLNGGEDYVVDDPNNLPVQIWVKGLYENLSHPYLLGEFKGDEYKIPEPPQSFKIHAKPIKVNYPDINDKESNKEFAKKLFRLVLDYHLQGYTVHINLAGGRKTMSAYALLAAVLFGAKGLYHVLVPERLARELRRGEKFHIAPDDVAYNEAYQLVEVPLPTIGEFLSEKANSEDGLTPQLQRAKVWLDVISRLAGEEKNIPRKEQIFTGDVQNLVLNTLKKEVKSALEEHKDAFPGPWEALRIVVGEDLGDPFADLGKIEDRFKYRQTTLAQATTDEVYVHPDLDVLILDTTITPDQKVLGLMHRSRRFSPHLPIVAFTQGRRLAWATTLMQAGATLCLDRHEAYRVPFALSGLFRPRQVEGVAERVVFLKAASHDAGEPANDVKTLIGSLFPEAEHIRVRPAGVGGVSQATKFWAWLDQQTMPHFIKIGAATELGQEKVAYEKEVRGHLDNFAGRIEREVIFQGQRAALAYTAVGLPGYYEYYEAAEEHTEGPQGLDDFVKKHCIKECIGLMERLLDNVLPVWYRDKQKAQKVTFHLGRDYGKVLPVWAKLRWGGFAMDAEPAKVIRLESVSWKPVLDESVILAGEIYELDETAQTLQISSPAFGYKVSFSDVDLEVFKSLKLHSRKPVQMCGTVTQTLEGIICRGAAEAGVQENIIPSLPQTLWKLLSKPRDEIWRSTIHGDLNLGNIRTDGTNLWLIDFARTGCGPIVYDFAKLEIEMRVTLTNEIPGTTLEDFKNFEAEIPRDDSPNNKALALIKTVRHRGTQYCVSPAEPWEYDVALLIYGLSSLKFTHLPKIKQHLLAVALAAAERLENA